MTARFRPLGSAAEGSADPAPPEFATAPWGYRRAEVDAWASWVAGLVAHGRNETVRADSAEATLRATLERLERLERSAPHPTPDDLPRRTPPSPVAPTPAGDAADPGPAPTAGVPGAAAAGPGASAPGSGPSPSHEGRSGPETARLQVVETTLQEVMRLLHRLVGPEQPAAGRERSPTDS